MTMLMFNNLQVCWDFTDTTELNVTGARHFVAASSELLDHADDVKLDHSQNITVMAWFKRDTVGALFVDIASKSDTGTKTEWAIRIDDDDLEFHTGDGAGTNIAGLVSAVDTTDLWYFAVGVHDDPTTTTRIYGGDENGVALATAADTDASNVNQDTESLRVGASFNGTILTDFFNGDIDELAIWHKSMTTDQVTWLYNGGAGRSLTDVTTSIEADNPGLGSLVAWYEMNEDGGIAMNSAPAGGLHLTETGSIELVPGHVLQTVGAENRSGDFAAANANLFDPHIPVTAYPFSFAIWVNTSQVALGTAIGMGSTTSATNYVILTVSAAGNAQFQVRDGGTDNVIIGSSINDSNWHLLVGTALNATTRKLYVDDIAAVTGAVSATFPTLDDFRIGALNNGGTVGTDWDGFLDEGMLFDAELTDAEVLTLYNDGGGVLAENLSTVDATLAAKMTNAWPLDFNAQPQPLDGAADFSPFANRHLIADLPVATAYPFSVAVWIKGSSVGDRAPFTSSQFAVGNQYFILLGDASGTLRYKIVNGGSQAQVFTVGLINDGDWHLITTVSAASNDHRVYFDDLAAVTTTSTVTFPTGLDNTIIGGWIKSGDPALKNQWIGQVDDAMVFNAALTSGERLTLYNSGAGLNESELKVEDATLHAKITNYWQLDNAAGLGDGASSFDGVDQYFDNSGVIAPPFATNETGIAIALWIKTTATGLDTCFSQSRFADTDVYLHLQLQADGTMSYIIKDSVATLTLNHSTVINDGDWHLVSATSKQTVLFSDNWDDHKLWIDDIAAVTSSTSVTPFESPAGAHTDLAIGALKANSTVTEYWNGDLDTVMAFPRHFLTDANVTTLWNKGAGYLPSQLENVDATLHEEIGSFWNLNEASGADLNSSFPARIHLTNNNTVTAASAPAPHGIDGLGKDIIGRLGLVNINTVTAATDQIPTGRGGEERDAIGELGVDNTGVVDGQGIFAGRLLNPLISIATDTTGGGRDLTQGTVALRPEFFENVVNGQPGAFFERSRGTYLDITAANWGSTIAQPYTFVIVLRTDAPTDNLQHTYVDSQTAANRNVIYKALTTNNNTIFQNTALTGNAASANAEIWVVVFDDDPAATNNSRLYVDGILRAGPGNTSTVSSFVIESMTVGDDYLHTSQELEGFIFELCLMTGDAVVDQLKNLNQINEALASTYGISYTPITS
jgi:hypothetical protein